MKQFSSSVNIVDKFSAPDINNFFRVRGHNNSQKRFGRRHLRHFLPSRGSRAEHVKSEKCQSCFSRQKLKAQTDFPASKTSRPLVTSSLALAPLLLNLPFASRENERRFLPLASLEEWLSEGQLVASLTKKKENSFMRPRRISFFKEVSTRKSVATPSKFTQISIWRFHIWPHE